MIQLEQMYHIPTFSQQKIGVETDCWSHISVGQKVGCKGTKASKSPGMSENKCSLSIILK